LFGANILCTRGIYPAELQAIARCLAMFPASCTLHIHSDSQGALAGIQAYEEQTNERKRLRMSGRPLLQLIHHLLAVRHTAGGTATFSHVSAHSTDMDIHSVGNRLADFQANRARQRPDHPSPSDLRELPVTDCEQYAVFTDEQSLPLIDDIRRATLARIKALELARWSANVPGQGELACAGTIELGRVALRHGSALHQITLVHVATNSIQYHWLPQPDGTSSLQQVQCALCSCPLTLAHLAECDQSICADFRDRLKWAIHNKLSFEDCTQQWRRKTIALELRTLLLTLFPTAASATADEQSQHNLRLLCGAVTQSQASTAARLLGFPSAEDGRETLHQLRLLCLEHLNKFYCSRKEAARA
jgi:hypothetical protein